MKCAIKGCTSRGVATVKGARPLCIAHAAKAWTADGWDDKTLLAEFQKNEPKKRKKR